MVISAAAIQHEKYQKSFIQIYTKTRFALAAVIRLGLLASDKEKKKILWLCVMIACDITAPAEIRRKGHSDRAGRGESTLEANTEEGRAALTALDAERAKN